MLSRLHVFGFIFRGDFSSCGGMCPTKEINMSSWGSEFINFATETMATFGNVVRRSITYVRSVMLCRKRCSRER